MARGKFIIGGLVILAAIVYLIVSSTQATAQYFLTVNEMNEKTKSITGQNVRISGAVIGDTIDYDPQTLKLSFTIANIPGDNQEIESQGGLAKVLHEAATNPKLARLKVVYNGPKPDLLRDEAQAILTGQLNQDGVFYAEELLLKCPTKYQEAIPKQAN